MSGQLAANSILSGVVGSILLRPQRGFGSIDSLIVPNVTVEEQHTDTLVITQHPVQQGAVISDHAYKVPPSVTIRAGWSSSSVQALFGLRDLSSIAGQLTDGLLGESYPQQVYNSLLALQESLTPFVLYTGKRSYQNMMMPSLLVTTDKSSEYSLMVTATFQQVNLVSVTTEILPAQNQALGTATASSVDTGSQAVTPATSNQTLLKQLMVSLGLQS